VNAPPDPLRMHAEAAGDRVAVTVDGFGGAIPSVTTYAELNDQVNRLARAFRTLGAAPSDRLVWCGANSLEVLVTIHAARKAGQTAVPLSYRFNANEMQYVIENSDATLVVVDSEQAPLVDSIRDRIPNVREVVVYGGAATGDFRSWDDVLAGESGDEPPADAIGPAGASMIYTSGTTGKPKGALRTTSDPATVLALIDALGYQPGDDVHLTTGPLYHSGPLAFATIQHSLGSSVVVLRKFDPHAWIRLVREHRVTGTFSAPTQLKRLVSLPETDLAAADCSTMRCLIANAAPVPYALKQEVIAKLGDGFLFEVYGSTELGVVTVLRPEDQLRKPGSCGRPYGGIEVRIVKEDGSAATTGEPGELFIRTALAMDGYHRNSEQLAELDAGEWKSVGDVAYVDEEEFVYICDRKNDTIISGGVNIYPAEIEAVIFEYPDILDVAVFGVPDDEWGERVHAVVQPKPGRELDVGALTAFVDGRVAGYKRPRSYEVRDQLPRTDAGKLLKRVLRDEHWQGRTTAV
jgi:acyl-CoA synthetase (AMP-forming)/AMP-acid ligase II